MIIWQVRVHDISMMDMLVFRPHNIMQTFLKMSSVVYSMAGLGSVEESKVYKDNFDEKEDPDSLKEEMRDEFNPKDQQQEVRTLSFLLPSYPPPQARKSGENSKASLLQ